VADDGGEGRGEVVRWDVGGRGLVVL